MHKSILLIMRHAKSDWNTGVPDFDRPLSKRGVRDARRMGKWLSVTGYSPDKIISSPAARARQTVELVCETAGVDTTRITWQQPVYGANVDALIYIVRRHFETTDRLMLVGHNPTVEALLHHLSAEAPSAAHDGKYMTTANIAALEFDKQSAHFLQAGSGRLLAMVRPKQLDS